MATKKISIEDFHNDPELHAHVARGREVALALDANAPKLPHAVTFKSLEFVAFVSEMTPKRVELLRAAIRKSRSISELAVAVHREQSAVSKDVARLTKLGLVKVQEVSNAGHGRKRIVVPVAESISINANFAIP
ncbi:ArsR family transcriptional regulator [Verminephrobacter aporrectodeae subsp. tuberculatae]|uniref:HVO_A0114 family putative DNA-binding protein n=1 Tax=Verminephrobacter aporrectodeae TaxID=1110389 RepID=UPI002243BF84|nr:ArsR family transcriptional regulator [Verminephrobacter aporrectodeae]MCW8208089.1 ArsR family transcriptional regulator [Verminephrobacter aporrectodeae subsp. tuberculatae]